MHENDKDENKVIVNNYNTVDLSHVYVLLHKILETVNINNQKLDQIMQTSQERYDALMGRLDTITNDIAADYKKLLEEAKNKTVSPESLAAGEANVAKLEALGASVDNPVPETPAEG